VTGSSVSCGPEEIPLPEGGFCSYSPDGKKLAYNRVMREFRTWKYYRGGMADDIWIYDPQAKTVENITKNDAQDIMPMWIGHEIFFISDRDMTMNIFVYNTQTKQTEKVTNYTDYDVKFPSSNGQIIVYEKGGYLYKLDPKTRQSTKITVSLASDNIYSRKEYKELEDYVTAASVSADGKRLAVTARGEVFDIPANQGVVRNITRTPGANDRGAQISPDGKYIAYISDKTGETEVWLQEQQGGEPVQLTKNNDTYIRALAWAPDSKTILYTDRKNRLVEVNVAAKSKRTVLTCPESEFRQVQFSPDSQWITYTRPEKNDMSVVYVYNLKTNKEYPVTEKWYSSSSPVFSTDGKYLIFNSNRDLSPIYSRVEWDYAYTNMGGIYLATLSKDTPSPLLPKDDQISTDNDSKPAGPQGGRTGEGEAKKAVDVKIDADGLFSRIVKLPVRGGEGYMSYFFSDGKKLWYQSGRSIMAFDFEKQEDNKVADGHISAYTAGGKKAIISDRNKLYVVDFPSEHIKLDKPVQMDNMVAVVDYAEEWPQIFDEVWRAFRDGFYLDMPNCCHM